ncbi:hypothetical protein KXW29_004040 [Aspergillus fumigatus]|nr:hypothetical protein KXW02_001131 [Aspergillus fumigatus]KAH2715601.1 hypothetical protein KXW29_004040 [Aspergillus fumigatus]
MSDTIITRADDLPEPKELAEAYELELQSQNGRSIRFGELVAGKGAQITTIDYVRVVSPRLTNFVLSTLPNPTGPSQLIIIGCGDSQRIVPYVSETAAAFPIYTDRTGKIYKKLLMKRTTSHITQPPSYAQVSFFGALGKTFGQMFRSGWQAFRGGSWSQNGGEWVFRGGKSFYVHRMEHVSDHLTADRLLEVLSLDEPAQTK